MKALIDTCVVIDALQAREPFADNAKAIFRALANRWFVGCITAKSATDIYYLTHRCTHSDKEARIILSKLYILFEILDTAGIDVRRAIPSHILGYEDAVMAETALRSDMDCIVTRNIKDYCDANVPVYTPEDFLRMLNKNSGAGSASNQNRGEDINE